MRPRSAAAPGSASGCDTQGIRPQLHPRPPNSAHPNPHGRRLRRPEAEGHSARREPTPPATRRPAGTLGPAGARTLSPVPDTTFCGLFAAPPNDPAQQPGPLSDNDSREANMRPRSAAAPGSASGCDSRGTHAPRPHRRPATSARRRPRRSATVEAGGGSTHGPATATRPATATTTRELGPPEPTPPATDVAGGRRTLRPARANTARDSSARKHTRPGGSTNAVARSRPHVLGAVVPRRTTQLSSRGRRATMTRQNRTCGPGLLQRLVRPHPVNIRSLRQPSR